jgi:hypothetical protein
MSPTVLALRLAALRTTTRIPKRSRPNTPIDPTVETAHTEEARVPPSSSVEECTVDCCDAASCREVAVVSLET